MQTQDIQGAANDLIAALAPHERRDVEQVYMMHGVQPPNDEGRGNRNAQRESVAAWRVYDPPVRVRRTSSNEGGNGRIDDATAAAIARLAGATDLHHRNQRGRPP